MNTLYYIYIYSCFLKDKLCQNKWHSVLILFCKFVALGIISEFFWRINLAEVLKSINWAQGRECIF